MTLTKKTKTRNGTGQRCNIPTSYVLLFSIQMLHPMAADRFLVFLDQIIFGLRRCTYGITESLTGSSNLSFMGFDKKLDSNKLQDSNPGILKNYMCLLSWVCDTNSLLRIKRAMNCIRTNRFFRSRKRDLKRWDLWANRACYISARFCQIWLRFGRE